MSVVGHIGATVDHVVPSTLDQQTTAVEPRNVLGGDENRHALTVTVELKDVVLLEKVLIDLVGSHSAVLGGIFGEVLATGDTDLLNNNSHSSLCKRRRYKEKRKKETNERKERKKEKKRER